MNKICTSIEQSKKLLELGIDINTADMFWDLLDGDEPDEKIPNCCWDRFDITINEFVPAWSLSALLELIPPYLGEFKDGIDFGFSKAMNSKWYSAHYIKFDSGLASFNKTVTGDTAIDAAFEMVCWLKENNKI